MKLWSLQPLEVAEKLLQGEPYICKPELSDFNDDFGFTRAYDWLFTHMETSIPKPENVTWPAWAWAKHYGGGGKPDRRRQMFSNYQERDVILELEVPDSEVLLSDFDDWHAVLNNCEIITDEEYYADEDRVYTPEEKSATWQQIFDVETKEFVQACLWQIKPEYLVRIHKIRKKTS